MKRSTTLLLCTASIVAGCGGGGGGGGSSPSPASSVNAPVIVAPRPVLQGKINTDLELTASKTGAVYPIYVYLPANYASSGDSLPTLYVLDAEGKVDADGSNRFQRMAEIVEAQGVRVMLVGVGNYSRRGIDYLLPGAIDFFAFLTGELIPAIDARYRSDSKHRGLAGHSYGGVMVLLALLQDRPTPHYFRDFIAQDGSFATQNAGILALEQQMFTATAGKLPDTTLILSSSAGAFGNQVSVQAIHEWLQQRVYQGWSLQGLPAYGENHDGMFLPSFRDSIAVLYQGR